MNATLFHALAYGTAILGLCGILYLLHRSRKENWGLRGDINSTTKWAPRLMSHPGYADLAEDVRRSFEAAVEQADKCAEDYSTSQEELVSARDRLEQQWAAVAALLPPRKNDYDMLIG